MTGAEAVQKFYSYYPYPHYPLLAKPRWQEGYLASSQFARKCANLPGAAHSVCIIGCGEILPYVIRQWEPRSTSVHGVDLSPKSLKRAQWRCYQTLKKTTFRCIDISRGSWHDQNHDKWDHIDAFGVLHHLQDPIQGLENISESLAPGGTMRVMVYNTKAREWIHSIQKNFSDLGLSPYSSRDLKYAKQTLISLRHSWPKFKQLTDSMGSIFENKARFADTFLHPQETSVSLESWCNAFKANKLQITGLFDRYGELDHLSNPLKTPPSPEVLAQHIEDSTFQGNLEFYLQKKGISKSYVETNKYPRTLPPYHWFSFLETSSLSWKQKWNLWVSWHQSKQKTPIGLLAQKRLARLGAIFSPTDERTHSPINKERPTATLKVSAAEMTERLCTLQNK